MVACVHLGLPQTVSEATPLSMASIWLPRFQPGAMARNTSLGVRAVVVAVGTTLPASSETITVTVSSPHVMVMVPVFGEKVRLALAMTDTVVSWDVEIVPASTPHQDASVVTVGCVADVTLRVASPPKRSKDSLLWSTASLIGGVCCVTGIIRLILLPMMRMEVLRSTVPSYAWAVTVSLKELFDKLPSFRLIQESTAETSGLISVVMETS